MTTAYLYLFWYESQNVVRRRDLVMQFVSSVGLNPVKLFMNNHITD